MLLEGKSFLPEHDFGLIINAFSKRKTSIIPSFDPTLAGDNRNRRLRAVSGKQRHDGRRLHNELPGQSADLGKFQHILSRADQQRQLWEGITGRSVEWQ